MDSNRKLNKKGTYTSKHIERYSTWNAIRKIQVKTRAHSHIPEATVILFIGGRNAKQYHCLGKR